MEFKKASVIHCALLMILFSGSIEGNPLDINRLWSLQRGSSSHSSIEPIYIERPILLSSRQAPAAIAAAITDEYEATNDNQIPELSNGRASDYIKKSITFGGKPLRRFNGSGSRNCFFTPIQCMIQHDMSKYKKLVDSNARVSSLQK